MQRCHIYKIAVSKYSKSFCSGCGRGGCERRIKVNVNMQNKKSGGCLVREGMDVNQEKRREGRVGRSM